MAVDPVLARRTRRAVSTGTYSNRFERRNGVWKCIQRTSRIDPNWPADLFQRYIDVADRRFKAL
jgi:hypothetical protein